MNDDAEHMMRALFKNRDRAFKELTEFILRDSGPFKRLHRKCLMRRYLNAVSAVEYGKRILEEKGEEWTNPCTSVTK